MHRRPYCCVLLFLFLLAAALPTAAAEPAAAAKAPADKPAAQTERTTPISVEHEGADAVGSKLAFQLKGAFNTSSLFTLTERDGPRIKIFLSTVPEFPGRPGLSSAYAVVWTFSQAEGTLSFLLAREVGLLAADEVDALVSRLAEKTDGIAVKYRYLFSK